MAAKNDIVYRLQGEDKLSPVISKTKKEIDGLSDKGKRLNEIKEDFDKMASSNATYNKKIAQCRKYMDELSQSGQKNTAVYKQLEEAARKYDKELKQINKDIKGVKGFDLKGAVGGVLDKVGLGSVSNEIAGAVTNPYVAAGAAIALAGKALYDYNAELDRSLQKTEQFTGLSGDALMQLRNGIKATADTYGKDYDTVLASVDGLMNQFGIDAQEALKIINKGFQGGADESGKMLDMIKQFSGSFKDAGISAAEMVAIIGNTRSGIFSEEGMQLFQKGAKNVREFSDNLKASLEGVGINADEMYRKLQSGQLSTVQAIQQISAKLKDLNPQSQEVGEVLKQVFGKTGASAGMELVTALSEVETNLDIVAQQTGDTGEAFDNLRIANEKFESALASLFGTSNQGFSTMVTKLKTEVLKEVANVIDRFIDWWNESKNVRDSVAAIAVAFQAAWEVIKSIMKIMFDAFQGLGEMIEGIFDLDWKKVAAGWEKGFGSILKKVSADFKKIAEDGQKTVETIKNHRFEKVNTATEKDGYTKGGNDGGINNLKDAETRLKRLQEELKNTNPADLVKVKELNESITKTKQLIAYLKKQEKSGSGNGDNKGGKGGKTTVKEEKVKTQYEIDKESLDKVNKDLQEAMSGFNSGLISKEQLEATAKEANDYYKEHGIKAKVDLEYSTDKNGFEQVKVAIQKDALTPLQELEKAYKDAEKELNSVDPFNTPKEKLDELKQKVIDTKNTFEEAKKALSTEVTASYKGIDNKNFEKGSVEDKRQSLAKANADAQQVKSDYESGIINADAAKRQLEQIREELKAIFPSLDIELRFNDDGTITTMAEKLEAARAKMDSVLDSVGMLGSAFSNLGSAIGGAGGEIVSFGGQLLTQGTQMVAQLGQIIAANQAAALAKGMSSAAGLMFPFNLAAIATVVATLTSLFASLPKFETGGIVGGTSFKGDKVLARVNSGEAIINTKQQNRMMELLNSTSYGENTGYSGNVDFTIRADTLYGVLQNRTKRLNRLG